MGCKLFAHIKSSLIIEKRIYAFRDMIAFRKLYKTLVMKITLQMLKSKRDS